MKTNKLFKPNVPMNIKNMSWPQAIVRFPLLNPKGDVDFDGVKNFRDCKPFDIKRQGEEHDEEEPSIEDEDTMDYFLGPDPRKHKDFKHFSKK